MPRYSVDLAKPSMRAMLLLGEIVVTENERLLGSGSWPLLYDAGVVYQTDPPDEPWMVLDQVVARGAGDCEDLAGWRAAELRHLGWRAMRPGDDHYEVASALRPDTIDATADILDYGRGVYHAVVHYPLDGVLLQEDPSARLGMRRGEIDGRIRERWARAGVVPSQRPRWI